MVLEGDVNPRDLVQKCACMSRGEIMLVYRLNELLLVVCLFCLLKKGGGRADFYHKTDGVY